MKRYKSKTPRMAIGLAAAAMTALTFGLSVVGPTQLSAATNEIGSLASEAPVAVAPIEVAILPAQIKVVAERDQRTAAFGAVRRSSTKKGQPS
ncbi:MAG: hypothetical protein ABI724_03385 [Betaproteobacteria bacterium]